MDLSEIIIEDWYKHIPSRLVFLHLLLLGEKPSLRTIARDTGLTVKQVRTALDKIGGALEGAQKGAQKILTVRARKDIMGHEKGTKMVTMKKPDIEEVKSYFNQRGASVVEAEKFFDFYESKGWMVGKNKMKDWKAAVRGWITRNKPMAKK